MSFERDVVSFVAFDRIRVADRPALAVLVAYEGLSVVADFARDAGSFRGCVGFLGILRHRVLSHQAKRSQQGKGEENRHQFFHSVSFAKINSCPAPLQKRGGGSHEGPNVESILSTLTHDYPSIYLAYTAKIKDKLRSNNTANAVVADAYVLPLSLKDQQVAQSSIRFYERWRDS
jgi:hypothetical protein